MARSTSDPTSSCFARAAPGILYGWLTSPFERTDIVHSHTHQITLGVAFFLGAIHALEPGHGKTAMLVYLTEQRRSFLHPVLMGLSSAVSHSVSLIGIAFVVHAAQYAVVGAGEGNVDSVKFWLQAISSMLVMAVGLWMLYRAQFQKEPSQCNCSLHSHEHNDKHEHEHDHRPASAHHLHADLPPLAHAHEHHHRHNMTDTAAPEAPTVAGGYSVSMLLGAAFGLLPCPSAVAAYLTGMAHGSAVEAYLSIGLFAFGIATSLTLVGLLVQKFGNRLKGGSGRLSKLPWAHLRAGFILLVGLATGLKAMI